MSIIEIPQMIDLIEDHFSPKWGHSNTLVVGGIVGTNVFQYAMDACMKYYEFGKILVIEGCEDYIGLLRNPMHNYIYWMNLFRTVKIPPFEQLLQPTHEFLIQLKSGFRIALVDHMFEKYDAIIINNAHMIPSECLTAIQNNFPGKVLQIIDPLDFNGDDFCQVHTLYDSLEKQSPLTALARSMFNIDSRAVDRNVRSEFKRIKMTKRSIGRIDTTQYVTNDYNVLKMVQDKQYNTQFRKNQKFIVTSDEIRYAKDQNNNPVVVGPGSLLSIITASKPLMRLRIHLSTRRFYSAISYNYTETGLYVKPANILMIDQACRHRFKSLTLVLGDEPMTNRLWYSIMKISNTITVVDF